MVSKQMVFGFASVCSFAGILYYSLLERGTFTATTRPYAPVDRETSLGGFWRLSRRKLNLNQKEAVRLDTMEFPHRKATALSLLTSETPISPTIPFVNSVENLEVYTLRRPSSEKVRRLAAEDRLGDKFMRNDKRRIKRIVDNLGDNRSTQNEEVFKKSGTLEKRFPVVIIIGVKKAGTRALLKILKLHPKVCACGPEMHFFDRYNSMGLEWYRNKMPLCYANEITVEKTPSYFVTKGVERDIFVYSKSINHTLKLLVIVRDPTTRAISDYTQTLHRSRRTKSTRKLATFEQLALTNTSDGLRMVNSRWDAIKIGVYSKHLRRWLNYFTLEHIHVVSGESLAKEPYEEFKKVEKFLDLPSFVRPEHFVYNKTKKFYCFNQDLSFKNEVITTRTPSHCLGNSKGRSHTKVPAHAEKLLREYYRPFNDELYRMVQRNFGWH